MQNKWKVFCDMDGVLADFLGSVYEAHNRPTPYDNPEAYGKWDTEKLWGISVADFWKPVDDLGISFWSNLKKTPEADEIVDLLCSRVGEENVAFLTAPHTSPACIPGKYEWLKKNYPIFSKRVIFGSAKEFLAGPNRVLVDDRDKNLTDFNNAGGRSIAVPRLWNSYWRSADQVVETIKTQLDHYGVQN